ncbi:MAG: TRAP transporter small permease [Paracoccaceae bacterium]
MTAPHDGDDIASFVEEEDEPPFSFSEYGVEDYAVLVVFWLLALDVFLQFFSRFVLGDSIGWTEEMARYLLIAVGFLGGAMAVRNNSHIMMEFMYRYMPDRAGIALGLVVDVIRLVFFALLAWLTWELAGRTRSYMASVDIPKSVVYYAAFAGFALMVLRTLHRGWATWPARLAQLRDGAATGEDAR